MKLNLLNQINNDSQSLSLLNQLDWHLIIDNIICFAHFERSIDLIKYNIEYRSIEDLNKHLDSLDFIINIIEQQRSYELISTLQLINPSKTLPNNISHLKKEWILELKHLNEIASLLEGFQKFRQLLKGWNKIDDFNIDPDHLKIINRKFLTPFRSFVTTEGTINYSKHPQLAPLYAELLSIDQTIRNQISAISKEEKFANKLQFEGHDVLNDRYVLAVRSDSYNRNLGHIRGRSESGFTLYVEPFQLVPLTDQRINLLAAIDGIVSHICQDYSKLLCTFHSTLDKIYSFVIFLDQIQAKAQYCYSQNFTRPKISTDMVIEIKDIFHPLIDNPVLNNISLNEEWGIIISGPNTGGKTATLKAVTLCALFVHYGLYVPASDATIPAFDGIFFQGNDQQNIAKGLSSFSAEVTNYLQLLTELGENNLIVIDEIFNSTSSEEASALAIGLFEEIHMRSNSRLLVSTHHHMLKTIMHGNSKYISAHVGFDLENNLPTYQIVLGLPGSSMALTIFDNFSKNYSLQHDITLVADKILDSKYMKYEKLLQEVQQKEVQLSKILTENAEINNQLKNQKNSMEGILKLKMVEEISNFRKLLAKEIKNAENIFFDVKNGDIKSKKNLQKKIQQIESNFQHEENKIQTMFEEKNTQDPMLKLYSKKATEITVNKKYYSTTLKKIITIHSLDDRKKKAFIDFKNKKIQVPVDSLREIPAKEQKSENEVYISITKNSDQTKFQIDCRGMRLDEFKSIIDNSLSDLSLDQIPYLEVIHGHGSGTLKNWIREHLRSLPEFYWERSDDDGITRIFNI